MTLRRPLVRIAGKTEQLPDGDTIAGGGGAGGCPTPLYPALKASIILFDFNPGTRNWTVPDGATQIRVFVVGAGGSRTTAGMAGGGYSEKLVTVTPGTTYSYTVGAPGALVAAPGGTGGTSSFGGLLSATGGGPTTSVGTGTGGDVNRSGGAASSNAGGGAGHAYGNGQPATASIGGGFSSDNRSTVDGWKIGMLPGGNEPFGYGVGAVASNALAGPGMGGGGSSNQGAGVGGGGGYGTIGGPGLVGIEVIA